jgi:hypothetical protein
MKIEKTVFKWPSSALIARSLKGNSRLSKPGGDCKALYQRTDKNSFYIRLALYEPVGVDIQYVFLVNVEISNKEKVIYQILCVPGRVDLFVCKNKKVKKLSPNFIRTYVKFGKYNIEIALKYRKLGLTRKVMDKAINQVIIEELGPGRVIKSDKKRFFLE